ncbi:MAG: ABC transporter ATP-binding protein [Bacillus sp. (in: Bacteria)]|nr:ABC transporter ATP-binding protein [Bacillus sp. (in: firmicutes)]MCM1427777.1 ABC transporter ATP-binding protein [Eubacterium sp.]
MELRIENLTKEFQGMKAVNGVSYTMEKGVYGLLGLNGAGKTTLMRMLCTLIKPTQGSITCNGEDIFGMGEQYRKLLGYLPQDFGFYPDLTVKDYLLYIASIKGVNKAAAKKRIKELLMEVGLSKAQDKKMKKLSGGMKRRAGIAQAMINNPAILILDEPTAGLDPNERIRFRNLISTLAQDRLVLLSTHIVSDIESTANEIIFMKEGKFLHTGSPQAVISAMTEKVWNLTVPGNEAEKYMRQYKAAGSRMVPEGMQLRLLSVEKPHPDAVEETPTLEDVFLSCMGAKAEEEEDAVL